MDDAGHFPVLLDEVVALLAPGDRPGSPGADAPVLLDCTVGHGGHAEVLLTAAGDQARLVGVDLDRESLLTTKERLARFGSRVRLFEASFAEADEALAQTGATAAEAILADLGVCSAQLDRPERGFSFRSDGPLDMRMKREGPTAADLVNGMAEDSLAELIRRYGEERYSRRVARAIVSARRAEPLRRTAQLAEIVRRSVPGPRGRGRERIDPATRTFQALRIAVNDELTALETLLGKLGGLLSVGGRVAIISFHSLEDRLVKQAFAAAEQAGTHRRLTRRPIRPSDEEVARNPRSRPAKLRGMERIL
jgi:16S rRNA (cytosine1402-N4)-methyltransferase